MSDELQTPLTPIEEARLHDTCRDSLTPAGMMLLRRLSFEKDRLKGCDEAVKRLVEAARRYRQVREQICNIVASGGANGQLDELFEEEERIEAQVDAAISALSVG